MDEQGSRPGDGTGDESGVRGDRCRDARADPAESAHGRALDSAPDVELRVPHVGDAEAVAAIHAHYVLNTVATFDERPREPADWTRHWDELAGRGLPALVAVRRGAGTDGDADDPTPPGQVLGFAHVAPFNPKPAYRHTVESTVYLAPGAGGRGIGTQLYGELLRRAASAGVRQVVALVAVSDDESSMRLHAGLGFAPVGLLTAVGHKFGRWIDVRVLQRSLPDPRPPDRQPVRRTAAAGPACAPAPRPPAKPAPPGHGRSR